MSKKLLLWIAGIVVIVIVIMMVRDGSDSMKVTLSEQNDSGEYGTITLSEFEGKTKVIGSITGAPAETPQPAHIHAGPCATIGAVKYPLTSFVNGASETVLDVAWADFVTMTESEPLAINIHKSATEANVYVACGDIES